MNTDSPAISSLPMNGGEGPHSYANNSNFQKGGIDLANEIIYEEIANKLDGKQLYCSLKIFRIADLGCSTGQNTLTAVQNIIKAVEYRCQSQGISYRELEYQVFFNDQISNDFNTLFKSLPVERTYFAAGVPGSFQSRIFPKGSLHFVHSSYALQWISNVPKEVEDKNSSVWNKGKIFYQRKEVEEAYAAQFTRDVECFLGTRASELQCGGFMALLLVSMQEGADSSKNTIVAVIHLLGSCLMDLAKMGLLEEAKVDSFNVPVYYPTSSEVESSIQGNGQFKIQRMEQWPRPMLHFSRSEIEEFAMVIRATSEGLMREQFGDEIVEPLYHRFTAKLVESTIFSDSSYLPMADLFVLLQRI